MVDHHHDHDAVWCLHAALLVMCDKALKLMSRFTRFESGAGCLMPHHSFPLGCCFGAPCLNKLFHDHAYMVLTAACLVQDDARKMKGNTMTEMMSIFLIICDLEIILLIFSRGGSVTPPLTSYLI